MTYKNDRVDVAEGSARSRITYKNFFLVSDDKQLLTLFRIVLPLESMLDHEYAPKNALTHIFESQLHFQAFIINRLGLPEMSLEVRKARPDAHTTGSSLGGYGSPVHSFFYRRASEKP